MFIDMHAHTGAISRCCRADAKKIILTAKEKGYDALVITNHYTSNYFTEENHREWIEKYIDEWHNCKALGKRLGVKIFSGVEVTYSRDPKIHLLIYGADEAFLRKNLFLSEMELGGLYALCKVSGSVLVQAHPFRNGSTPLDPDFIDGVEINCHPAYKNSFAEEIKRIAAENDLIVTVGCDYHNDTERAVGGMFLPDFISTEGELADYLKQKLPAKIQIEEPKDGKITVVTV